MVVYVCGLYDTQGSTGLLRLTPVKPQPCSSQSPEQHQWFLPQQASSWCRAFVGCARHDVLHQIAQDGAARCATSPAALNAAGSSAVACSWSGVVYATPESEGIGYIIVWESADAAADNLQTHKRTPPRHLTLPVPVAQLSAGEHHALILGQCGRVWAVGQGLTGQLGAGHSTTHTDQPVAVLTAQHAGSQPVQLSNIRQVACGFRHSCAVNHTGSVFTWGWNGLGCLGSGTQDTHWTAQCVCALGGVVIQQVAAGAGHTLALSDSGDVYAWGWNRCGQLGLGHTQGCTLPTLVESVTSNITQVSAGAHHSLLLTNQGEVFACGANTWGQLGQGHTHDQHTYVRVPLPQADADASRPCVAVSVQGGWCHSVVLVRDGEQQKRSDQATDSAEKEAESG